MWGNWSGLEDAHPTRERTPTSADEVLALVRTARERGERIKMMGSGHSFTGISVPDHTLLWPQRLSGVVEVDRSAMTVTALAGTPLAVLNAELAAQGLALHNMGDIDQQTLAGATSTGTHGSGGVQASLSAQLSALALVTGDGTLLHASPDEHVEIFEMARVGLGSLGILTTLTFDVEPAFLLQATEQSMGWEEFADRFEELADDHHHLDAHWFPHTDRVLVKLNDRLDDDVALARPPGRLHAWVEDELLSNGLFGVITRLGHHVPAVVPRINQLSARALSDRSYSDLSHRVFTSPRRVRFREMEYAVPRAVGMRALREARRVIDAARFPASFPVEVRATPADDIPLSTGYGRDAVHLAFHVPARTDHTAYFGAVEEVMRAHRGRPHWGKLHTRTSADLGEVYDRFDDFVSLRDRLDPDRLFTNAYLERILG